MVCGVALVLRDLQLRAPLY